MKRQLIGALIASCVMLTVAAPAVQGQGFKRYGPIGLGGYPSWYQDKTGLALEFCSPKNQSELDGGWCLLLPGDTTAPEVFPSPFFDEHFYWAASADAGMPGGKALLTLALEGAFAVGPVIAGDQIVFGRLRIVINPLPSSGTYTVYTPFGKYVFADQVAGDKLFFTEDIGIQCAPGDFSCALASKIGPFLLPSATPGGAEMPALSAANPTPDTDPAHFGGVFAPTAYPGTGNQYIADPARIGPVTGSPLTTPYATSSGDRNPNIFRIEGPAGEVFETVDFGLQGRVFEGAVPGRVTVDRASYARSAAGNTLSVFATGFPSTQARIPGGPAPAEVLPILQYYDAPCVANLDPATGALLSYSVPPAAQSVQIRGSGTTYWGQSEPAAIPLGVCVVQTNAVDAGGAGFTAFFPASVGDLVTITQALYDPATESLTIAAGSSDLLFPKVLTAVGFGDLAGGTLVASPVVAPPSKVLVRSAGGGEAEILVKTGAGGSGSGVTVPTATNDVFSVQEDSSLNVLAVTTNDVVGGSPIPAGSIVQLTSLPQKGQAQAQANGTVTYTPNPNANGPDSFAYTVAVNGIVSNQASVTVNVAQVNDVPVAVNNTYNAVVGIGTSLNVLANDLDADGAADIVAVANLSAVTPAGATATVVGGAVQFTAAAAGTYTFTYRAQDLAGAVSANAATVTVIVSGGETINVTLAEFRTSGRLRFTGTITPVTTPPQRLTIKWFNGTNTASIVATPTADATGAWAVDIKPATGIQDPRNSGATQYIVTSPSGASRTGTIAIR